MIHCCRAWTRTQVFCKADQFFSLYTVFWYRSVPEGSNEYTLIYINKRGNARCRVMLTRKTQPLFMWNLFSTDCTPRDQFSWPQEHKRGAPKPRLVVRQAFNLLREQWLLICLSISRYKYISPQSLVFLFALWLFFSSFKKNFFLLYNIVLFLPYINMHPPRVYTCSPSCKRRWNRREETPCHCHSVSLGFRHQ